MPARLDITGQKFNFLTGVRYLGRHPKRGSLWLFACDCGKEVVAVLTNVTGGNRHSCGCHRRGARNRNFVHGKTKDNRYEVWVGMKQRCHNPNDVDFDRYGGRGITVCERWCCREGFINFMADMGPRPNGMSIERNDVNGNYCPENCRWATQTEQTRNTSQNVVVEWQGQRRTIAEWAEILGINYFTLNRRITRAKLPLDRAMIVRDLRRRRDRQR